MKFIAIVTSLICLTSCGLFKKNQKDGPTKIVEEPVAEQEPTQPIQNIEVQQTPPQGIKMTYGEVCESFLSALQSGSVDQISQYFLDVTVARAIAGKETNGKTDKDVQVMIDGMTSRFMENIEHLRTAADENNVNLNGLRVRNCLYFDSEEPGSMINFLTPDLSDGSKDYKTTLTIANYSGKTYVMEIVKTTNVFNKP